MPGPEDSVGQPVLTVPQELPVPVPEPLSDPTMGNVGAADAVAVRGVRRVLDAEVEPGDLRRQVDRLGIIIFVAGLAQEDECGRDAAHHVLQVAAVQVAGRRELEGGHAVVEDADQAVGLTDAHDAPLLAGDIGERAPHEQRLERGVAAGARTAVVADLAGEVLPHLDRGAVAQAVRRHGIARPGRYARSCRSPAA